ncbi:MAG: aminoacyl-tRNA hydrolase [Firmicutes bacterium]|nr:aminoacyl-tRNA hydrolase [Bacillota bacterium]
MYVICGLGNPGREYEYTRHNMGFITIDVLAEKLGVSVNQLKFKALVGETRIGGEKVLLVKPQTYMNLSGESLRPIMDFYKLEPDHFIIIYDDSDLAVGALRLRGSGSPGSHNGMKSVVTHLGSQVFPRIRIGIGSRGLIPMERFVLGHPTEEDRPLLAEAVKNAADAAVAIIEEGMEKAMTRYNTKKESAKKENAKEV